MKTYTLEELKLAQAKGCRIEYCDIDDGEWHPLGGDFANKMSKPAAYKIRIHPADEWKARLPRLKEGAEWCKDGANMPEGVRPFVVGEIGPYPGKFVRLSTTRPVPAEFLHPDELASQWCPMCAAYTNHGSGDCPQLVDVTPSTPAPVATPTDTPETDAAKFEFCVGYERDGSSRIELFVEYDFARTLERRARAAEAKVKELEQKITDLERGQDWYSREAIRQTCAKEDAMARNAKWESELSKVMPADFKDWWQNSRDEWPEIARMVIEGLRKNSELVEKAAEAALRLRPIAEAGPVPEGAVRLFGYRHDNFGWVFCATNGISDTHFIDIYPPQQQ